MEIEVITFYARHSYDGVLRVSIQKTSVGTRKTQFLGKCTSGSVVPVFVWWDTFDGCRNNKNT